MIISNGNLEKFVSLHRKAEKIEKQILDRMDEVIRLIATHLGVKKKFAWFIPGLHEDEDGSIYDNIKADIWDGDICVSIYFYNEEDWEEREKFETKCWDYGESIPTAFLYTTNKSIINRVEEDQQNGTSNS